MKTITITQNMHNKIHNELSYPIDNRIYNEIYRKIDNRICDKIHFQITENIHIHMNKRTIEGIFKEML